MFATRTNQVTKQVGLVILKAQSILKSFVRTLSQLKIKKEMSPLRGFLPVWADGLKRGCGGLEKKSRQGRTGRGLGVWIPKNQDGSSPPSPCVAPAAGRPGGPANAASPEGEAAKAKDATRSGCRPAGPSARAWVSSPANASPPSLRAAGGSVPTEHTRNSEKGDGRAVPQLLAAEFRTGRPRGWGRGTKPLGPESRGPLPGEGEPGRAGEGPADPPLAGRPERYLGHGFRRSCRSAHTRLHGKAGARAPEPPGPQPQTPDRAAVRVQTLSRACPLAGGHVTLRPAPGVCGAPPPRAVSPDAMSRGLRLRAAAAVSRGAESLVRRFSASRCGV